jgi:hypothetical protein
MDPMYFPVIPMLFGAVFGLLSLAWYVGVIVLLLKIWKKVKHLHG